MICPECNGRGESVYYIETHCDENSVTLKQRKGICRTCNGSGKKKQTNADRIQAMSDDELAEFIKNIKVRAALCKSVKNNDAFEELCSADWLQQPPKGVNDAESVN